MLALIYLSLMRIDLNILLLLPLGYSRLLFYFYHTMHRISTLLFCVFLYSTVFTNVELNAQPVVSGHQFEQDSIKSSIHKNNVEATRKPQVSLSMGTSFSSFGPGMSGFGTFVAPEVSLPVTDKFSVSFGIAYSSMFLNSPVETGLQNNRSYGSVYVSGAYQVNDNLRVRGTAYKTFLLNSPEANPLNPAFFDASNQGFAIDAEYKVNDKFRIGVSVEYRDMNQPSYYPNNGCGAPGFNSLPSPIAPFSFGN